jgi:hypothetical protein
MPESIRPVFDTLINAGLGLRLFQAFARSLLCPAPNSTRAYQFFFRLIQNLADNKDRLNDCASHADIK